MPEYIPFLRTFLEKFQTDEALKSYRKFVNVQGAHEEDIKAINEGDYEIIGLKYSPDVYGGPSVFDFKVGKTSFHIWGEAVEYIMAQANKPEGK